MSVALLLLLAIAGGGAALVALRAHGAGEPATATPDAPVTGGPRAVVDAPRFDIGTINSGNDFSHTFTVRNAGDAALTLSQGGSTCHCTIGDVADTPVEPGGEMQVTVHFTDVAKRDELKSGPIAQGVTILTNDPRQPQIFLEVAATVELQVQTDPTSLVYQVQAADAAVAQSRSRHTLVYSTCWKAFELKVTHLSCPGLTYQIEPAAPEALAAKQALSGYDVTVVFPADTPDGFHPESLALLATPRDPQAAAQELAVSLFATFEGRLTFFGRRYGKDKVVHFGTLAKGQAAHESLLMKVGAEPRTLTIVETTVEPACLRVRVAPYEAAGSAKGLYRVELDIPRDTPSGNHITPPAVVRLKTDHPQLPAIEIKVAFAVINDDPSGSHGRE